VPLVFILFISVVLIVPVSAAGSADDDMVKKLKT
jgi:hypothetical protein